ncbi:uncharacterized protein LOC142319743 isoform X2 [Lycorma delicatula]|uniref:uncharacterized protein LOC142319743 isoform X2 n=1 Tax=Lycorma delicatula TaxID=130591 RepID=UPI003F517680
MFSGEMNVSLYDSIFCRLCAEENPSGVILHGNEGTGDDLCSMINHYLPIKIQDDGRLPRTICPGCNIQLHATVQFFDLLIEGQKKLRELWKEQVNMVKKLQKQSLLKPKDIPELRNETSSNFNLKGDTVVVNNSVSEVSEKTNVTSDQPEDDVEKQLDQVATGESIYSEEHHLSLKVEGLEKPRRKRGRPRKRVEIENNAEGENEQEGEFEPDDADNPKSPASDVGHDTDNEGRKRRRRKVPVRYKEAVQGKELERIFREEGVIDEDEEKEVEDVTTSEKPKIAEMEQEVIGHLETQDGQNLGELIVINRIRANRNRNRHMRRKKVRFHCEICGRGFLHQGRYLFHKSFHMGVKFECEECKKRFTTKENFDLHQKVLGHSGEGIVKELDEGSGDGSKEVESGGKLPCAICEKTFMSKQSYEIHLKAVHEGQKPFVCNICNKGFGYQNSLKCHVLTHHESNNVRGFPCDICGKRLNHPSSVIYHKEAEHNNGRRFVCDTCGKGFKHKQLLQRHQLVHSDVRPYHCNSCSASFKSKANLLNHQSTHTGEKKHFCEICGQQFAHKTSLTLHYRWHSGQKPYQCHVCKKRFSQKGNLHEHIRIHTGEKPFTCDYCERKFTTSSQYKLHLKRHTGERPWKCDYCGKAFLHKDTWKCHMRRHKGEKPFQCTYCTREFPEQWALKKHLRLHTGERPYSCEVCGKAFADCSNLTKHKKVHDREIKIEDVVGKTDEEQVVSVALQEANGGTEVSGAAVATGNGNDLNVWNIIRQFNTAQVPEDDDDVHQIIYVTYQDPEDPNSKISEKFIVPDTAPQDDNQLNTNSEDVTLTTLPSKSLQVTDEQGNPIRFTMQDGSELQIMTADGENLQVTMKDGQTIPVQISATEEDEEEEDEETGKTDVDNSTYHLALPHVLTDEDGKLHHIDENIQTYEFMTEDGQKVRLAPFAVTPINQLSGPEFLNVS